MPVDLYAYEYYSNYLHSLNAVVDGYDDRYSKVRGEGLESIHDVWWVVDQVDDFRLLFERKRTREEWLEFCRYLPWKEWFSNHHLGLP